MICRPVHRGVGVVCCLAALTTPTFAQTPTPDDLFRMSLEQLLDVRITSAERKEQRAEDAAAAVYVITQDDIRRSGLVDLPDILRLAPGVQVAQVNGTEWAVSVRGFNGVYSDKLLVLIDGRSLYNRGFSGVFWDDQAIVSSDIDRIEVIRGPGGTAWGANAVNGVINVITKSAAETKGTLVQVGAGSNEPGSLTLRHGGAAGAGDYRVYSRWIDRGAGVKADGSSARDGWDTLLTGTRLDWSRRNDTLMAQGSYLTGYTRPNWLQTDAFLEPMRTGAASRVNDTVALGRWTHRGSGGSILQTQTFHSVTRRDESTLYARDRVADIDLQFQTAVGGRHEIVTGGGYRDDELTTRGSFTLKIDSDASSVLSGFLEDSVRLTTALQATVGAKAERDSLAGWGLFPSARLMWKLDPRQRAWAAVSRARRTPSAAYRTMRIYGGSWPGENGLPVALALFGNPEYDSEQLTQLDAGYRVQLGPTASVDVTGFRGGYEHSTTIEQLAPRFEVAPTPHILVPLQYGNLLDVETRGLETTARWSPVARWRMNGSYSYLRFTPRPSPATTDPTAGTFDGSAPRHQWQMQSTASVTSRVQATALVFRVGQLRQWALPAYTRADARLEVKLSPRLAAVVTGQNLLQPSHAEFSDALSGLAGSRVPRSGRVQLQWEF